MSKLQYKFRERSFGWTITTLQWTTERKRRRWFLISAEGASSRNDYDLRVQEWRFWRSCEPKSGPNWKRINVCFLFQVIPDLLERGAHQLVQFLLRFCYLLLWEALGFPEQWAAAINLVYDLSGQSYHTFHPSCSAEDGPIVFAINWN